MYFYTIRFGYQHQLVMVLLSESHAQVLNSGVYWWSHYYGYFPPPKKKNFDQPQNCSLNLMNRAKIPTKPNSFWTLGLFLKVDSAVIISLHEEREWRFQPSVWAGGLACLCTEAQALLREHTGNSGCEKQRREAGLAALCSKFYSSNLDACYTQT